MLRKFCKFNNIHFVGIGGIGMSGIAEILFNMGFNVTGSDIKDSLNTEYLRRKGVKIAIGHRKENVIGSDLVVYSTAIRENNPELLFARDNLIPAIKRGEMLAELMRLKYSITVSGSHGKTTTTSLIAEIFSYNNLDPTVIIGGRLARNKTNASYGTSSIMISEADESDRSFLLLYPTITINTNIDSEHFETYKDIDEIKKAFIEFNNKVPFYGYNVLCLDDNNVADIIPYLKRRLITYGIKAAANVKAVNIENNGPGVSFDVVAYGKSLGRINLNIPGMHNVLNALAAIAVSLECDIDFNGIKGALENFEGVERRLTCRYKCNNIVVIDDYAHHPMEIQSTIKAIRDVYRGYKIHVIFQPHRYTRLKYLFNSFTKSFFDVDKLYIVDIYSASEEPIVGIHSKVLVDDIKMHGLKDVYYINDLNSLLSEKLIDRDNKAVYVTMGAGDITKFSFVLADFFNRVYANIEEGNE
ncbi:MAG: UDP-N-acetylmuramate--L-alanine ligase [Deferribacterota bacterium]|nr:UDP-N-acetylmuramate--L-alanine ligase [Deferribacterota bacterium]